ncbi:MAG TPA: hypothetical protein VJ901_03855, partial [Thermoanaerobaculia bacterium]|nr:hypothetical protein [Thermoanaerobaculia bacterium]
MNLQDNLIESSSAKRKGGWKASIGSVVVHGLIIAFVLFMSATTTKIVDANEKPIRAYIAQGAAPPPPPPPPPPAASAAPKSAGSPKPATPKQVTQLQLPKPVQVATLIPPVEIPKEIPPIPQPTQPVQLKIADATTSLPQPMISSSSAGNGDGSGSSNEPAGVPGGVPGGVAGGVPGGTPGGVVGGQVGGVQGGV